ncbi:hypothetical protein G6F68_019479 [Rhizopus microsporus]|nr:hypothetical protein G6F68_019479 [Rhizopus microsporus]
MPVDADLASRIVWFDAFTSNVDRTTRNPNLMVWHRKLYLIDHGAAMYFHHDWANAGDACEKPFVLIRDHVLLSFASRIAEVDAELAARLTDAEIERIVSELPSGIGYEWTGLSYQEKFAGAQAPMLFALAFLVVFLLMVALYESWAIPEIGSAHV